MFKNFRHSVLAKIATLLLLTLVLAIALARIDALNDERGRTQQEAADELARTHAGSQRLAGPLLILPYTQHWQEQEASTDGKRQVLRARSQRMQLILYPERLHLDGQMAPQERYRGIFKIPFYTLQAKLEGHFAPFAPARIVPDKAGGRIEMLPPFIVWQVSDLRGLDGSPTLLAEGEAQAWRQGLPEDSPGGAGPGALHAVLSGAALQAWRAGKPLPIQLTFSLVGQRTLAMVPLAGETTAHLTSPWRSPSFGGDFLAAERSVDERGFDARWRVSSLVTQARAQFAAELGGGNAAHAARTQSFQVSLVEPLNVYTLSARAGKYGLLFITLVLLAAFTIEQLRALRLHPVQYALVGMSIALFFLLLLALSEKMAFITAYASAAAASVLLLVVYFSAVLRGWRRGLGFGAYVALLYAALYGLLVSEDNALLLGALLTFGLLAVLMLATRRVDWYALSQPVARDMGTAQK